MRAASVDVDAQQEDRVLEAAKLQSRIEYLYPFQRLVVANSLDAAASEEAELRRQVVVLPTGSGKTLCFMVPAELLAGITVVVYPLLALMKDQARRAHEAGLDFELLRGGMSREERNGVLFRATRGDIRLLITNPEMLSAPSVVRSLADSPVDHLVIDEAHCVSEWGESFRPSYLELGTAIARIDPKVTTAFTATASPRVLKSIQRHLFADAPARLVLADPDRPNISYSVLHGYSKLHLLRMLVADESLLRPALVFCRSRTRTEEIARMLVSFLAFETVAAYHAGLDKETREAIESWFFSSTEGVLVSTCAYGMGVDKSDVRTVIHYEPPASVEAFLQESGRAGRDRRSAESILLVDPADFARRGSDERFDLLLAYASTNGCRREFLMRCMGAASESCFGCDSCVPKARPAAIWQARAAELKRATSMIQAVTHHPRALVPDDLIRAGEHQSERRQLLSALLHTGALSVAKRPPWRGRLQPGG